MSRKTFLLAMLLFLVTLTTTLSLQNAAQIASIGVVQGTVTREGTTDPLPGVQITLAGKGFGPNALDEDSARKVLDLAGRDAGYTSEFLQEARDVLANAAKGVKPPSFTAVTDSSGHFLISGVPVGAANVLAELQGYFGSLQFGGYPRIVFLPATVTAEKPADVHISMIPWSAISGRVTDSSRKPISNLQIFVLRSDYYEGKVVFHIVDKKNSDDRGAFRIFGLPPGEYFVVASPLAVARDAASAVSGAVPVKTFYPGVTDISQAVPIVLKGGEDRTGVDLQVISESAVVISGKAITSLPPGPITVSLMPHNNIYATADFVGGAKLTANSDGTFQIPNVMPGTYDLFVRMPIAEEANTPNPPERLIEPWAIGRTTVDVHGSNVSNVNILVTSGVDIKGRITVDGKPFPPDLHLPFGFGDTDGRIGGPDDELGSILAQPFRYSPRIGADGSFLFPNLPPARYRFYEAISGLPERAYLFDILQDGKSVYDNDLVVDTQSAGPLEVIIKTDGGSIEGTVFGADRKAVAAGSSVVLVPPQNRRQNPELYKVSPTDAQGHFSMNPVPPGLYALFAWENVKPDAYMNADFMRQYEGRGVPVNVSANLKLTTELVVIP